MDNDPERAKLDDLSARIKQAEAKSPAAPPQEVPSGLPMNMNRVGFEFVGTVLCCTLLGWLADTGIPQLSPWALIAMLIVGFASGFFNIWRALTGKLVYRPIR